MTDSTKPASQLHTLLERHFLTCSAAATTAVLIMPAPSASGAIVFSGNQLLPIFSIDINGGVYFDVEPPFASAQATRPNGWEFNPYRFGQSIYVNGNTMLLLEGDVVANLPEGTPIDNFSTFSKSGFYGSLAIGQGDTGYIGFKFDPDIPGVQTYYGWVQMKVGSSTAGDGSVIAWAYDNTGAPIAAGAGAVPEPDSLTLLALGSAGVAMWRRRSAA